MPEFKIWTAREIAKDAETVYYYSEDEDAVESLKTIDKSGNTFISTDELKDILKKGKSITGRDGAYAGCKYLQKILEQIKESADAKG